MNIFSAWNVISSFLTWCILAAETPILFLSISPMNILTSLTLKLSFGQKSFYSEKDRKKPGSLLAFQFPLSQLVVNTELYLA